MTSIPSLGLGTFRLQGQIVTNSVLDGLELGYRSIDTAQRYGNEAEIGTAIAVSGVPREDIFLTTKVWVDNYPKDRLADSLEESLARLRTSYLDLTLIHWPAPNCGVPLEDYMIALVDAKEKGLTRRIGVSNFNVSLVKQAEAAVGKNMISTNQIELSPYLQNRKLVEFLQREGIHVTSYMTLAYGKVLEAPVINAIARRQLATPAQVALAWALSLGYSVIPSSTKREHLASNLLAQHVRLTREDMEQIAGLECNCRMINPDGLAPEWD